MLDTAKPASCETFVGDGFVPYYLAVDIQNPSGEGTLFRETIAAIKQLKTFVREGRQDELNPRTLSERLLQIPSVVSVVAEGAYSSIVIPLAMIGSLSNASVFLHGVVGSGPITDAIEDSLEAHGIELVPKRLTGGDSPVEISVRDAFGHQETLRFYPVSRTKYRQTFLLNKTGLSSRTGFVLSRYNAGRAAAFLSVANVGGLTSLRIAESTRYVTLADYLSLLPHSIQTFGSHRDDVLKKLGRHLLPNNAKSDWTKQYDPETSRVVQAIVDQTSHNGLVVVILETELVFAMRGFPQLRFRPPSNFDTRSRAARVQGACAAIFRADEIENSDSWMSLAEKCVQAAFRGSEARPSEYPTPFKPESSWKID